MSERWEQLTDEPDAAYARFLVYRNMGVARSLDAAYRLTNPLTESASKRVKTRRVKTATPDTRRANGQWAKDCRDYHWDERAKQWDIETLNDVGKAVVVKYVNALDLAIARILQALANEKMQPRGWAQVIETLTILGNFIPQETVAAVRQNPADAAGTAAESKADDVR